MKKRARAADTGRSDDRGNDDDDNNSGDAMRDADSDRARNDGRGGSGDGNSDRSGKSARDDARHSAGRPSAPKKSRTHASTASSTASAAAVASARASSAAAAPPPTAADLAQKMALGAEVIARRIAASNGKRHGVAAPPRVRSRKSRSKKGAGDGRRRGSTKKQKKRTTSGTAAATDADDADREDGGKSAASSVAATAANEYEDDDAEIVDMRFDARKYRKQIARKRVNDRPQGRTAREADAAREIEALENADDDAGAAGAARPKRKRTSETQRQREAKLARGELRLKWAWYETELDNNIVCVRPAKPCLILALQRNDQCERCRALREFFVADHGREAHVIIREVDGVPDPVAEKARERAKAKADGVAVPTPPPSLPTPKVVPAASATASATAQSPLPMPSAAPPRPTVAARRDLERVLKMIGDNGGERAAKQRRDDVAAAADHHDDDDTPEPEPCHELYFLPAMTAPSDDAIEAWRAWQLAQSTVDADLERKRREDREQQALEDAEAESAAAASAAAAEAEAAAAAGRPPAPRGRGRPRKYEKTAPTRATKVPRKAAAATNRAPPPPDDPYADPRGQAGPEVAIALPTRASQRAAVVRALRAEFEMPEARPARAHQQMLIDEVARWNLRQRRAAPYILAWDPGTGKTEGVLRALAPHRPERVVAIVPKTMVNYWVQTFEALPWAGDCTFEVLGNNEAHAKARRDPHYYDGAVVVVDEAQYYRGLSRDMVDAMDAIRRANAVFLLSGTIVVHDRREVASIYAWFGVPAPEIFGDASTSCDDLPPAAVAHALREFEQLLRGNVFWYSPEAHESADEQGDAYPEKRTRTVRVEMSWLQSFRYLLTLRAETRFGGFLLPRRGGGSNSYDTLACCCCNMIPDDLRPSNKVRAIGDRILARYRADPHCQQVLYSKYLRLGVEGLLRYIDSQLTDAERDVAPPLVRGGGGGRRPRRAPAIRPRAADGGGDVSRRVSADTRVGSNGNRRDPLSLIARIPHHEYQRMRLARNRAVRARAAAKEAQARAAAKGLSPIAARPVSASSSSSSSSAATNIASAATSRDAAAAAKKKSPRAESKGEKTVTASSVVVATEPPKTTTTVASAENGSVKKQRSKKKSEANGGGGGGGGGTEKKKQKYAKDASDDDEEAKKKVESERGDAEPGYVLGENEPDEEPPRFTVECITGATKDRQTPMDRYNAGAVRLMVLTDAARQGTNLKGKRTVEISLMEVIRAKLHQKQTEDRVFRFNPGAGARSISVVQYMSIFPTRPATAEQAAELQSDFDKNYGQGKPTGVDAAAVLWDIIQGREQAGADDGDADDDDGGMADDDDGGGGGGARRKKSKARVSASGADGADEMRDDDADDADVRQEAKKTVPPPPAKRRETDESKTGGKEKAKKIYPLETVDVKFARLAEFHHRNLMPWIECFQRASPFFKDRRRQHKKQADGDGRRTKKTWTADPAAASSVSVAPPSSSSASSAPAARRKYPSGKKTPSESRGATSTTTEALPSSARTNPKATLKSTPQLVRPAGPVVWPSSSAAAATRPSKKTWSDDDDDDDDDEEDVVDRRPQTGTGKKKTARA